VSDLAQAEYGKECGAKMCRRRLVIFSHPTKLIFLTGDTLFMGQGTDAGGNVVSAVLHLY
jgi:hypothetical protein